MHEHNNVYTSMGCLGKIVSASIYVDVVGLVAQKIKNDCIKKHPTYFSMDAIFIFFEKFTF